MKGMKVGQACEQFIYVRMDYDEEWLDKIRSIEGRKWDQHQRVWKIPFVDLSITHFLSLFEDVPMDIEPELLEESPLFKKFSSRWVHGADPMNLLNKYRDILKLRGYSLHTQRSYYNQVERFLRQSSITMDELSNENVRSYLLS